MDGLIKLGAIVLLLGALIFVHELGHFLVAKLLGVKVVRFSIGFGPRLLGVTRGETEYQLALLPLGGYVKMAGNDPSEEVAPEDRGRGFLEQAPWKRLAIMVAGPLANLVLPVAIYAGMALAQDGAPTPGAVLGTVLPGSPAEVAGLRPGDRVLTVTPPGEAPVRVRWFSDLREAVIAHPAEPLAVEVERGGSRVSLSLVPAGEDDPADPAFARRRGLAGVSPAYPSALVAPARPGAGGPLEPFDLVVRAGPVPVRHLGQLEKALAAAACAPLDLEVIRARPAGVPGAALSTPEAVKLAGVPTCLPDGSPALVAADFSVAVVAGGAVPGSPAARAGLRRGDRIVAVNGRTVHTAREIAQLSRGLEAGKEVRIGLADGRTLAMVPAPETYVEESTGRRKQRLALGIVPAPAAPVDPGALVAEQVPYDRGLPEILGDSTAQVASFARTLVLGIAGLFTGRVSHEEVGSIIQIVQVTAEVVDAGLSAFLYWMGLLSVNLALLNLLPIPILDGGQIVQALLEAVTRRPLSVRARELANVVGLVLIVALMILAFSNDIGRIVRTG